MVYKHTCHTSPKCPSASGHYNSALTLFNFKYTYLDVHSFSFFLSDILSAFAKQLFKNAVSAKRWIKEMMGGRQVAGFGDECCSRNTVILQGTHSPAPSITDRKWSTIYSQGTQFGETNISFFSGGWLGNAVVMALNLIFWLVSMS